MEKIISTISGQINVDSMENISPISSIEMENFKKGLRQLMEEEDQPEVEQLEVDALEELSKIFSKYMEKGSPISLIETENLKKGLRQLMEEDQLELEPSERFFELTDYELSLKEKDDKQLIKH